MRHHSVIFDELRQSLRAIRRAKGTTAVVLLSLALGTGANAAVFTTLDALLLRGPAGVDAPARLVDIFTSEVSGSLLGPSSLADYVSIATEAPSLAGVAAIDDSAIENVQIGEMGQSARIASVTDGFFAVLQMHAEEGRLLASGDTDAQPAPAVISAALAESLGGRDLVGKTMVVADRSYVVVGIAPPRFRGLRAGRECDVWVPLVPPGPARGDRRLSLIARLAPRADIDRAAAELAAISNGLASRYPATNRGSITDPHAPRLFTPRVHSALDPAANVRMIFIAALVAGASTLLLASACFNVGNLLLSWAVARRHEIAIKMALGASRGRLVRQLLIETQCLSIAGGVLGVLFSIWTSHVIPALFMSEQAELLDTRLDPRTIVLTIAVACVSGALFGVAPALHGTASPAVTALRGDAGGVSEHHAGARLRALLVTGQVMLSTVLLLGAGGLVTGLSRALEGDRAATAKHVAVASMELPGRFGDQLRGLRYRNELLTEIAGLPGVVAVGWASALPLGRGNRQPFQLEGKTTEIADTIEFDTNVVSPGYFAALDLPCVEGRPIDASDQALTTPVAVVDELLARRYFGAAAVGRHLVDAAGTRREIVGVVRTGFYRTLEQTPQPTVYVPVSQEYLWRGHLLVRTAGDPATMIGPIAGAARAAGEGGVILRASTLDRHVSESLALDRLTTTLIAVCGLIALGMSTIGVYGTMADTVQRRTREIGLRVALGARRLQVARLIFSEAMSLAAAGLLAGAAASFALTLLARVFFADFPSLDLVAIAAVGGALTVAVAVAAILPLRRALRVHPNIALRAE